MPTSSKPEEAPTESTSLTGKSPADAPKKSKRSLTSVAITALPNFATEYNYMDTGGAVGTETDVVRCCGVEGRWLCKS